ncbi:MAG: DoxX family protein [Gammaproteobacteria bacterium]|nr:DoxX family protein [Gammaproteobacteria bacterium]
MNHENHVKGQDALLLAARVLLALLFAIFGWQKLTHYSGTLQYMMYVGAPLPVLATIVAIAVECGVSIALISGIATRPLAILLAVYTFGAGLIAHHYWTMTGMARFENEINFWKNVSIIGGLLILYVTGPGKYSLSAWFGKQPDGSQKVLGAAR